MNDLSYKLYFVQRELEKKYKNILNKYNLSLTEYMVLDSLFTNDELILRQICDYTQLEKGTIAPVLKKLEKDEYIARKRPVSDERTFIFYLLRKGKMLKNKLKNVDDEIGSLITLNQKEKNNLLSLLDKINEKI